MPVTRYSLEDHTFVSSSPEELADLALSSDPEVLRAVFWEESELADLLCGMIDIRPSQTVIDDILTLSNPRGGIIGQNSKLIAEGIQGAISAGAPYRFAHVRIFNKHQWGLFAGPYHFYWGDTQEQVLHEALRKNCTREEDPRKEKLNLRRFRDAALVREAVDTMREREMERLTGFYHLFWRTDPFIGGNHQKLGIIRVERFGEPVFVYTEDELALDVVRSRLGAELAFRQPPLTLEEAQRGVRRRVAVLPALYELEEESGRATLRRGDWSLSAADRADLAREFCQYLTSDGRTLGELSKIMFAEDEAAVRARRTGGSPEPWDGLPVELLRSWVVDWQADHGGTIKWQLSDSERSCIGAMYGAEVWYQGRHVDEDIIEYLRGWSREGWDAQADLSVFEEKFVDLVIYGELRFDVRLEDLSDGQRTRVSKEVELRRRGVGGRRASLLDLVEMMLMFGQKFDRRVRDQVVLLQWADTDWWNASRTLNEATDEEAREWSASSNRDVVVVGKSAASVREVVRCLLAK